MYVVVYGGGTCVWCVWWFMVLWRWLTYYCCTLKMCDVTWHDVTRMCDDVISNTACTCVSATINVTVRKWMNGKGRRVFVYYLHVYVGVCVLHTCVCVGVCVIYMCVCVHLLHTCLHVKMSWHIAYISFHLYFYLVFPFWNEKYIH